MIVGLQHNPQLFAPSKYYENNSTAINQYWKWQSLLKGEDYTVNLQPLRKLFALEDIFGCLEEPRVQNYEKTCHFLSISEGCVMYIL